MSEEDPMGRVILLANDKGGVGKTSTTSNCAGQFALNGYKVLVVDLNNQGNAVIDFGCAEDPINDEGEALFEAITMGRPIVPQLVPERDNLWLASGGEQLEDIPQLVASRRIKHGANANLALRKSLEPVAGKFDIILVDTPPENLIMLDLGLAAARWLLIPTKTDTASIRGMRRVASHFVPAREINPEIMLMGAVLFATGRTSTKIHSETYAEIEEAFGGNSPLFKSFVGHSEALARAMRSQGKLAHELEKEAADQPAWWQALRSGGKDATKQIPGTATNISSDYSQICVEMVEIIMSYEEAAA
ncbi:ParA family protein [Nocardiopsis sp. NPDC055824]